MKKLIALILVYVVSIFSVPLKVIAEPGNAATNNNYIISLMSDEDKSRYYLNKYGEEYGANMNILNAVVRCESQFGKLPNGDFKNGEYLAVGIGQYHKETWNRHTKISGLAGSRDSVEDQARQLAWTFAKGSEEMKREWTTYRAIKNGGEYSFFSSVLNKQFTVKCKV